MLHGTPLLYVCVQGNLFLNVRFRALDEDALNSSHAVSTNVNTSEQVEEMFDSVSYEKVQFYIRRLTSLSYSIHVMLMLLYLHIQRSFTNSI